MLIIAVPVSQIELARRAALASLANARVNLILAQRQCAAMGRALPADIANRLAELTHQLEQLGCIVAAPPSAH